MVMAEDSRSRDCGFESHRVLDGKLLQCNLKENGENKGSQMGQTTKKNNKVFEGH